MEKGLRYSYDKDSDELNVSWGEQTDTILAELEDEVYVKLDPGSKEVMGFTILHFEKRFRELRRARPLTIPIVGHFELAGEAKASVGV